MTRIKDTRDFDRERAASARYEELRKLDATELRMEARFQGINPLGLSRQQIIASLIEKEGEHEAS